MNRTREPRPFPNAAQRGCPPHPSREHIADCLPCARDAKSRGTGWDIVIAVSIAALSFGFLAGYAVQALGWW